MVEQGLTPAFTPKPPRKKKKRDNRESRTQQLVIRWWKQNCKKYGLPELALISIPNGGHRFLLTAVILKKEGMHAGAPDLFLFAPRRGLHGLALELKTPEGTLSFSQRLFETHLKSQGYAWACCRSAREAVAFITEYLK